MWWGFYYIVMSSLCRLHQIRVRSSDGTEGRASLNPAAVYLDIAAGWKVNSGRDSKCTPAPEKPENRGPKLVSSISQRDFWPEISRVCHLAGSEPAENWN